MRGKRNVQRKAVDATLIRKADGRLRPPAERDIADVWAEIDRAKLGEAIQRDKKKRARRERMRSFFSKGRTGDPVSGNTQPSDAKTIEINIKLPDAGSLFRRAGRAIKAAMRRIRLSRKQKVVLAAACVGVVLFIGSLSLYGNKTAGKDEASEGAAGGTASQAAQAPAYETVLPEGKTIKQLGGWGRVSPPDKDPVFAFIDTIGNVQISVSQQLLPADFKANLDTSITKLADQFNAHEKIAAGDSNAYVGTSAQGPQSVILTKKGLLILVKSAGKISNADWETYLKTLK